MQQSILIQISPEELDRHLERICETVISRYIAAANHETVDYAGAARILHKSVSTIKRMKARGELSPVHPAGQPRFLKSDVIAARSDRSHR